MEHEEKFAFLTYAELSKKVADFEKWKESISREQMEKLTLDEIMEIEPALRELETGLKKISSKGDPKFCANDLWYGCRGNMSYRALLNKFVGWEAHEPALRTMYAHDLMYQYLYGLLPDCRHRG
jgi:hypothetical protein